MHRPWIQKYQVIHQRQTNDWDFVFCLLFAFRIVEVVLLSLLIFLICLFSFQVMYLGFEHIEAVDPNLSLYEHGKIKYKTLSASKYRYMFEFDTYETAVEWQRIFKPWMMKLKKNATQ